METEGGASCGVAGDGEQGDADGPGQDDDQRADGGEDRAADEDVGEHGYWPFPAAGAGARSPDTGAPSRIFCTPETISFSPAFRPDFTT